MVEQEFIDLTAERNLRHKNKFESVRPEASIELSVGSQMTPN